MERKKKRDYTPAELAEMDLKGLENLLTDKQKLFVHEYMQDKNGTRAAIRAGYAAGKDNQTAAVTASKLLRDEAVCAYRKALIREEQRRLGVSREEICKKLEEIADKCMQAVPVMTWDYATHQMVETGEYAFDSKGAISALEKLANMLGYNEPEKEKGGVIIEMDKKFEGCDK